jgi:MFS family permease
LIAVGSLRALPRSVWLIGLISLLNDTASEMVYPLLPLLLVGVLGAGPRVLGLIEGLAEALSAILKLVSGHLSDRRGRSKPWIVTGYALAALARPLMALAGHWSVVAGLRLMDRVGKGLRSAPRDALLAGSVAADQRGLAFGLHRAMDNLGAVLGPLLAWLLLGHGLGVAELFLWTGLAGAACVLLALALTDAPAASTHERARFDWRWSALPPRLRRYLLVLGLFQLGNSANLFLLLRASELGTSDANVALYWALASGVAVVFGIPAARLSDRIPRQHLLVAGWLLYAALYLGFGLSDAAGSLPWLFAGFGLYLALTEGAEKALVADLAGAARGTAYGWFHLISGLTLLPASLLMGALWEALGALPAFGVAATLALGAALALPWALTSRSTDNPASPSGDRP